MKKIDQYKHQIGLPSFMVHYGYKIENIFIEKDKFLIAKKDSECLLIGKDLSETAYYYQNISTMEDQGSIFNFIINRPNLNPVAIDNSIEKLVFIIDKYMELDINEWGDFDKLSILEHFQVDEYWNQFLSQKPIEEESIKSENFMFSDHSIFKDRFKAMNQKPDQIAFPIHNKEGKCCGLWIVEGDQKYFDPYAHKHIGIWFSNLSIKADTAVIVSTPLHALAHHQMHYKLEKTNVHYYATFGDLNTSKKQVLKSLLEKKLYRHIHLAHEDSLEGLQKDFEILSHLNFEFLKGEIAYKNDLQFGFSFYPSQDLSSKALTMAIKIRNNHLVEDLKKVFAKKDHSILESQLIYVVKKTATEYTIIGPNTKQTLAFIGQQIVNALKISQRYYIGEKYGLVKELKKEVKKKR